MEFISLRQFLQGHRTLNEKSLDAKSLYMNNCIAAGAQEMFECISPCVNLTELRVLKCIVNPTDMDEILTRRLPFLEILEWSLFEERFYDVNFLGALGIIRQSDTKVQNLFFMYVEVVGRGPQSRYHVLNAILDKCATLKHLYVHAACNAGVDSVDACGPTARAYCAKMESFTYTNEGVSKYSRLYQKQRCRPSPAVKKDGRSPVSSPHFESSAAICGSLMYYNVPEVKSNCVALPVRKGMPARRWRTIVAALRNNWNKTSGHRFNDKDREAWSSVRCLAVGSYLPDKNAPAADGCFPTSFLSSADVKFLDMFFYICGSIVELNLNAAHFSDEIDWCYIVSGTLQQLKALAVPRCALNRAESFNHLALWCRSLKEVDVRVKHGCTTAECGGCAAPMVIYSDLSEVMRGINLRRFTLWNVDCPVPDRFLRNLEVSELRVSLPRPLSVRGAGGMLAENENLTFLVYEDKYLNLGSAVFQRELARLKNVRYLCLITHRRTRETVVDAFLGRLQRCLAHLTTVHLHYSDSERTTRRVTWIRLPSHCQPARDTGVVLRDKPCVLCSTSTFIGLTKPRNQSTCEL